MAREPLLSKATLLGDLKGGSRRRSAVVLSLIESHAARAAVERNTVNSPFMTESALTEQNQAYLGAVAAGIDTGSRVSIQDLERSADSWLTLVPHNPAVRADIARRLGEKYRFTQHRIPRVSAALGLDTDEIHRAFSDIDNSDISTIYADRLTTAEQVRWSWFDISSKIESLPPFWTAFALTLTETVGAGTLALPIAFATIGPLAGIVLLVLLGLVNLATVAYLAEASARNGSIRYGNAFVGRLVHDYLGRPASIILRICLFALCCTFLASYYTGFASTISAVSGLPEPLLVGVVFIAGLFLILRKSIIGTLASSLVIGFINITILIVLSLFALGHATTENLLHSEVPFLHGNAFEPSHIQLVFGVVMVSYFGHLSVSNCAQAVLRRDPDGRSLKLGTVAAMAVAIAIYCLWSFSIAGAVGSEGLRNETGTALVPLAQKIGPEVYILGVVFAVLGLGMSSVHFGLGIFNMSKELINSTSESIRSSRLKHYGASLAAALPIFIVFGYVQWTYFSGTSSFTAPLEIVGPILTPIFSGIFPVALIMASRAQGLAVRGARISRIAANKVMFAIIVLLSFTSLLLHGLVITDDAGSRAASIGTAVVILVLLCDLFRRRAFTPIVNIDIRYSPEDHASLRVLAAFKGNPIDVKPKLKTPDKTDLPFQANGFASGYGVGQTVEFTLPENLECGILIDAHRVTGDFVAHPLRGEVWIAGDESKQTTTLNHETGQTRLLMPANQHTLSLTLKSVH